MICSETGDSSFYFDQAMKEASQLTHEVIVLIEIMSHTPRVVASWKYPLSINLQAH